MPRQKSTARGAATSEARLRIEIPHTNTLVTQVRAGLKSGDVAEYASSFTGYAISSPVEFAPGVVGRYRNSDPMTLGYLVRQAVEARGEDYLTHPQRALFDRIGIRRQVLEPDPWGNFLLSGYDYGTARNWARLGMLYLQDGVWNGQRLLPEGWTRFVSTPAPAWTRKEYGGQFWVNGEGQWPLPRDAYFMSGAGGQQTFVVPSHDLVVVRMGHQRGAAAGTKTLQQSLAALVAAVEASRGASAASADRPAGRTDAAPSTLRAGKADRRFVGNWRLVSFVDIDERDGQCQQGRERGGRRSSGSPSRAGVGAHGCQPLWSKAGARCVPAIPPRQTFTITSNCWRCAAAAHRSPSRGCDGRSHRCDTVTRRQARYFPSIVNANTLPPATPDITATYCLPSSS